MQKIEEQIAQELDVSIEQINSAIKLLDEGATVPFIARYRKEATGGLSDVQLRRLSERLLYIRELNDRRDTIINALKEQKQLTPQLESALIAADNKQRLESLYQPYKKKRQTRGQMAKTAGLEPLAEKLLTDIATAPSELAAPFIQAEGDYADEKAVLEGAKYILMEQLCETPELLDEIHDYMGKRAYIISKVLKDKENEGQKFRDYFEHEEAIAKTPSHRALALLRGRKEGILQLKVDLPTAQSEAQEVHPCETIILQAIKKLIPEQAEPSEWLQTLARWTWRVKIQSQIQTEQLSELKTRADDEAIKVFAQNLDDLLMAAPAGQKATLGLDPGIRTGVKATAVDGTGKLLAHTTVFPHEPQNAWDESIHTLAELCKAHNIELISIGNGTASRETDKLVHEMLKKHPDISAKRLIVNEAGASVYSASEYASKEFPELDVSFRGAVSIARRLQDPLAELVKIDPKSIGVGQYQHDTNRAKLSRALESVVEDCVNAVGVDVNTASAPLLARIAGLNETIANNIVNYRDQNGSFASRDSLKSVPRLGNKTFEQAAGFLRVTNGSNPLDTSAVHPESYCIVEKIAADNEKSIGALIGDKAFLQAINAEDFVTEQCGLPTVIDIISELEKPGRDPRPEFKTATFKEGIDTISDLKPDMVLEGVISNVTNFGAFVDIGVHQDGLIHISMLSNKFISSPREVVKTGDIVTVKVIEIDVERNRISLSKLLDKRAPQKAANPNKKSSDKQRNESAKGKDRSKVNKIQQKRKSSTNKETVATTKLADLFANAKPIRTKK